MHCAMATVLTFTSKVLNSPFCGVVIHQTSTPMREKQAKEMGGCRRQHERVRVQIWQRMRGRMDVRRIIASAIPVYGVSIGSV